MAISTATVIRLILLYIGGVRLGPLMKIRLQGTIPVGQLSLTGLTIPSINGIPLSSGLQGQISSFLSTVSNPAQVLQGAMTDALQQVFRNPLSSVTLPIVTTLPTATNTVSALVQSPTFIANMTSGLLPEAAAAFSTAIQAANTGLASGGAMSTALSSFVTHTNSITGGGLPSSDGRSFGLREISAMQSISPGLNIAGVTTAISAAGAAAGAAAQSTLQSLTQTLTQLQADAANGIYDPVKATALVNATNDLTTQSATVQSFVDADKSAFESAITSTAESITSEVSDTISQIAGQFQGMSDELKNLVLSNIAPEFQNLFSGITGELASSAGLGVDINVLS